MDFLTQTRSKAWLQIQICPPRRTAEVKIALSPGKFPIMPLHLHTPVKAASHSAARSSPVAPFAPSKQDFEASFLR